MPTTSLPNRFHGLLLLVITAITITAYVRIPAHLDLSVHWGPHGEADWFWPKDLALLLIPAIGLLSIALFWCVGRFASAQALDPHRDMLDQVLSALLALLAAIQFGLLLVGVGSDLDMIRTISFALSGLLLIIGNELRKAEPGSYGGLKLPWTMHDRMHWRRSHQVNGWLWILASLALALAAWFWPAPGTLILALLAAVLVPAVLGGLYSLLARRRIW